MQLPFRPRLPVWNVSLLTQPSRADVYLKDAAPLLRNLQRLLIVASSVREQTFAKRVSL